MRFACLAGALMTLSVQGCTAEPSRPETDGGGSMDAGRDAPRPIDAGPARCSSDGDCDDTIACTLDQCSVDRTCRHTPLDDMCSGTDHCSLTQGCTAGCTVAEDCSDGMFCNGVERCIAGDCFNGDAADCDDGNMCTTDVCDPVLNGCRYETAPGCDAGTSTIDAGMPCDAFVSGTHYAGTFRFLPVQASACFRATFTIDQLAFSVSGGALHVQADRFDLTESPAPTGSVFHVRYTDSGCGTYELMGTFSCADRFSGTWRASFSGDCAVCANQNAMVVGIRR